MKDRKSMLIFLGAIFSLCPFFKQLFGAVSYILKGDMLELQNYALSTIVNMVFFAFVVLIAALQIQRNRKGTGNRLLPIVGIVVSGLYFVLQVLSAVALLPNYIVLSYLGLINTLYALYIKNLVHLGIIGHILLIIGYSKSISKRV